MTCARSGASASRLQHPARQNTGIQRPARNRSRNYTLAPTATGLTMPGAAAIIVPPAEWIYDAARPGYSGNPPRHFYRQMTKDHDSGSEVMISIVISAYNLLDHVEECLRSIDGHDFEHRWEAILIDDCSTDASADTCRRFIERRPGTGFRLLEKPRNLGVSATRNRDSGSTGSKLRSGFYFDWLDSVHNCAGLHLLRASGAPTRTCRCAP